jgi:predicted ATP-grasp superfamily ATP-dependent carboligase
MILKENLPLAIVLHIAYTGYGVVRSLAHYGIPVVAFQKDLSAPEAKSKLCKQLFTFKSEDELLDKLIVLAKNQRLKPTLFITSDVYVEFYVKYRNELENYYLIDYPDSEVVDLLLSKNKFIDYAVKHDLPIPRSIKINSQADIHNNGEIVYPAILKPYVKSPGWLSAKFEKAYLINSEPEMLSLYEKVKKVEPCLLIQEMIPGPDSSVEYCLTYFNQKNDCLCHFTGAKIRQWPVYTGSTASTKPIVNHEIETLTLNLFKELNYRGFGSVEFKKHSVNNKYYIMEPTVGRPNQQSYVATANGINMPLIAYQTLTGLEFNHTAQLVSPSVTYIDEWADIASALVHFKQKQLTFWKYVEIFKGKKSFRYLNKQDPAVFVASLFKALRAIPKIIKQKI